MNIQSAAVIGLGALGTLFARRISEKTENFRVIADGGESTAIKETASFLTASAATSTMPHRMIPAIQPI
jgi:ketopantoate reductase